MPGPVVRRLRELGHDAVWVKEALPGEKDRPILARAQSDQRVTDACAPDVGELAFRFGLPANCGVVLLRIPWTDPETDNALAASALTSRDDWGGVFPVVERDRIRIRPFPKSSTEL